MGVAATQTEGSVPFEMDLGTLKRRRFLGGFTILIAICIDVVSCVPPFLLRRHILRFPYLVLAGIFTLRSRE